MSAFVYGTSTLDPFSRILSLLRPQAVDWRLIEAPLEWTFRFVPDRNVVIFGQAIQGGFDMVRDDGLELHGEEGDFMLMASSPPWVMRRRGSGPMLDFKAYIADPRRFGAGCDPTTITRFIGGHFTFAAGSGELGSVDASHGPYTRSRRCLGSAWNASEIDRG